MATYKVKVVICAGGKPSLKVFLSDRKNIYIYKYIFFYGGKQKMLQEASIKETLLRHKLTHTAGYSKK